MPKKFISAGIGKNYLDNTMLKKHDFYVTDSGHKVSLPLYYRNYLFTEDERDKMWTEKLDEDVRYVMGTKIDNASVNKDAYYNLVEYWQKKNNELGYNFAIDWDKFLYENERRLMLHGNQ